MNKTSISTYKKHIPITHYLNKKVFKIGYNCYYKIPLFVWYRLSKYRINSSNIIKRPYFYSDDELEYKCRAHYYNYRATGYDRGHMAPDASFDYDNKILETIYVMSNIVPQKHLLNSGPMLMAERYARYVTMKLKYTYIINIAIPGDSSIKNNINIPKIFYKIIINNKYNFLRIFKFTQKDSKKKFKTIYHQF